LVGALRLVAACTLVGALRQLVGALRNDAACVHPAAGFTQQDNLIPWHLQKSFKKEACGHGQDVEQKNRCARSASSWDACL